MSVAHLLAALLLLFVIMPFVDHWRYGQLVESALTTLVLLASVNAVSGQRWNKIAVALAVPAILARWLNHLWPESLAAEISLLVALLFVVFVIVHLLRFVVTAPTVNAEVLCTAVSIYLLLAVAWSFLYTLLAEWNPHAFVFADAADATAKMAGFNSLYFSVQVLTTITFGDIMPLSNVARMTTIVEAVVGVLYMAIMIARLVGLYANQPPASGPSD